MNLNKFSKKIPENPQNQTKKNPCKIEIRIHRKEGKTSKEKPRQNALKRKISL